MINGIGGSSFSLQDMEAVRQARFKKTDANGDGKITKEELTSAIPRDGKGPTADEVFSKVDTNQDGAIDQSEDKVAFEQMGKQRPPGGPPPAGAKPDASEMADTIFKEADTNGDGKVSSAELSAYLSGEVDQSDLDQFIKALDSDEDGSITQSELEKGLKTLMEQNGPPPPPDDRSGGYDKSGNSTERSSSTWLSAVA
jgi:Ca2+-binding EF-hand superfamily protein